MAPTMRGGGSEMTLNFCMTVEMYPNPNEGVGGSILDYEFFSLFDKEPRAAR